MQKPNIQAVKAKIVAALQEAGIAELSSFAPLNHFDGLPPGVRVDPGWTPVDGNHLIVVTPLTVEAYTLLHPTVQNRWEKRDCRSYATPEEMVKHVEAIQGEGSGCWA